MAKILKAVNVEVPTVGHCYSYYPVSVEIVGSFNYYRGGTTPVIIRDVLIGWKAEEPSGPVWTWQQTEEPPFLPGMQPRPSRLIVVTGLFWVHLKLYKLLYTDNQTFITKY